MFVTLGEGVVFGELSILNVPGRWDFENWRSCFHEMSKLKFSFNFNVLARWLLTIFISSLEIKTVNFRKMTFNSKSKSKLTSLNIFSNWRSTNEKLNKICSKMGNRRSANIRSKGYSDLFSLSKVPFFKIVTSSNSCDTWCMYWLIVTLVALERVKSQKWPFG